MQHYGMYIEKYARNGRETSENDDNYVFLV